MEQLCISEDMLTVEQRIKARYGTNPVDGCQ
jgi:hypothetical protein